MKATETKEHKASLDLTKLDLTKLDLTKLEEKAIMKFFVLS
jgi:hypothetical protein